MDFASGSKIERRIIDDVETWVFIAKSLSISVFKIDFEGSTGIEIKDLADGYQEVCTTLYPSIINDKILNLFLD